MKEARLADVQLITLLQAKLIKSLSTGGFSRENSKHVVLFFTLKIKKKKKKLCRRVALTVENTSIDLLSFARKVSKYGCICSFNYFILVVLI